ncbi:hypothetical protein SAMN04515649_1231 [Eubacterium callanderi]|uniref:Phage protein n=1 Tax=Eubacterium callanderi TaxID=53442 RepID=A0AB74F614_9FIRM|nr:MULTISPECIES: hypothetical protein [Eubacterium]MCC3399708.1 hypothetical protein [Eubacterium callanderi]MDY7113615.1 hypothetical protein [Eubacterium callanderi]RHO57697.1 hypothetical protein DW091_10860 [Eubacterium sp. AM05-23]WPK77956.1 hypothetical protein EUCAG14_35480 [Eubacterium callanderi]SHM58379.1 hypothetical protein SAMN04515649_1231 [Eubacterium callanderi]
MQLSEINSGALQEVFDYEFDKVLRNIRDVNTDPKAKRKVTIEMTISPNEKRTIGDIDFKVKHTEAPINGFATAITITEDGRKVVAEEIGNELPGQMNVENVLEMEGVK